MVFELQLIFYQYHSLTEDMIYDIKNEVCFKLKQILKLIASLPRGNPSEAIGYSGNIYGHNNRYQSKKSRKV